MRPTVVLCAALAVVAGARDLRAASSVHDVGLHAHLVSSEPAEGDTLSESPSRVRLVFSEPIEEAFSRVALIGWRRSEIQLRPGLDPSDVRALVAEVPALEPGGYRLEWRILSADGHPVHGSFTFFVRSAGGAATAESLPPPPEMLAEPEAHAHGEPAGETGEPPILAALVRAGSLVALLGAAGLLALIAWVLHAPPPRLYRVAVTLALLGPLLLAADFLLWLQHAGEPGRGGRIAAALSTQTGQLAAARIALTALALAALALGRRTGIAAVLTLLALVLAGGTGHPAAIHPTFAIPAKAIHLIAAALWLGGLIVLALGRGRDEEFRVDALTVSALALWAVVAIALTGVLQTVLFVPRPLDLLRSTYGYLVLAKLGGLIVLAGLGALNRFRLIPALEARGGRPLRRSVTGETGLMVVVIVIAAFLAYVPPPQPPDAAEIAAERRPQADGAAGTSDETSPAGAAHEHGHPSPPTP